MERKLSMKKPELLSPAGDPERLQFAVRYGADAVYFAGTQFGMRAAPKNFTPDQIAEGAAFAHVHGKRAYLTLNTTPTNAEAARLPDFIRTVRDTGVDALIVADLGVLSVCKRWAPDIDIHFSTQAGIANYLAANAAYDLGAKRVVLARELSLQDIAVIRDHTPADLELEVFVHGAMCMSVSGRCLLSQYLTGRSANSGRCTQPCRWKWALVDEEQWPGRRYPIGEGQEGAYILNADDLCTAPFIDQICKAGADSLKIEGRAKSFYYVASVTSAYRRALDAYFACPEHFACPEDVLDELTRTSHRRYSTGFFFGPEGATQNAAAGGYIRRWEPVAVVERWENGFAACTQRGKFTLGDTLEALTPEGKMISFTPQVIFNEEGLPIESTPHPMMRFAVPSETALPPYTILRRQSAQ